MRFEVDSLIAPFLTFEQPNAADSKHIAKVSYNGSRDILELNKQQSVFPLKVTILNSYDQLSDTIYSINLKIACSVYPD